MHVRTILIVFAALAASCKHVESSASPPSTCTQQPYLDVSGDRMASSLNPARSTCLTTVVARITLRSAEFLRDVNGELRIAAAIDEYANARYFYFEGSGGWRELGSI